MYIALKPILLLSSPKLSSKRKLFKHCENTGKYQSPPRCHHGTAFAMEEASSYQREAKIRKPLGPFRLKYALADETPCVDMTKFLATKGESTVDEEGQTIINQGYYVRQAGALSLKSICLALIVNQNLNPVSLALQPGQKGFVSHVYSSTDLILKVSPALESYLADTYAQSLLFDGYKSRGIITKQIVRLLPGLVYESNSQMIKSKMKAVG